ncbi:IS200/IS605 family transposase [Prescottella agglutinans]|uniref:Transposase n=1 Tax=Prescottella agglutinans TaxID=1644129 RepID=A0ABT6MLC9_9NOCA|nr:IS200/IS605 family transposase [Prescottella agglutinans]MDH6285040.1 putative transposase [Prescottella agglutinans]
MTTTIRFILTAFRIHLVFVTKYRRGALTESMLTRCEEIMAEVSDKFGSTLVEFNGETDHVHLLVHYPPTVRLSTLVNSLKGVSARYLRQEFPDHVRNYLWGKHFWSPSYFVAPAGGAPLAIIAEYIVDQQRPDPSTR